MFGSRRKTVHMQLAGLRATIRSIRRTVATQTHTHGREEIRMQSLSQEVHAQ